MRAAPQPDGGVRPVVKGLSAACIDEGMYALGASTCSVQYACNICRYLQDICKLCMFLLRMPDILHRGATILGVLVVVFKLKTGAGLLTAVVPTHHKLPRCWHQVKTGV